MEAAFEPTKPDNIVFTLSITMPLSKWKELKNQLANDWPANELGDTITNMIRQANSVFYPKEEQP